MGRAPVQPVQQSDQWQKSGMVSGCRYHSVMLPFQLSTLRDVELTFLSVLARRLCMGRVKKNVSSNRSENGERCSLRGVQRSMESKTNVETSSRSRVRDMTRLFLINLVKRSRTSCMVTIVDMNNFNSYLSLEK